MRRSLLSLKTVDPSIVARQQSALRRDIWTGSYHAKRPQDLSNGAGWLGHANGRLGRPVTFVPT